jgi:hypothetical protein
MYIQRYVVPVCVIDPTDKEGPRFVSVQGTAFFINDGGVLVTAAHVIRNATASICSGDQYVGICAKDPGSTGNVVATIDAHTFAPEPWDVAVGVVSCKSPTILALGNIAVDVSSLVSTYGYPENALNKRGPAIWMQVRGHQGYVQRPIGEDDTSVIEHHPSSFELSFPISRGMSGSPLIMGGSPRNVAVGVCVGSWPSELVDYSTETVEADGTKFREKVVRVEQFGIAHDLRPLLEWRPDCLGGKSLKEASDEMTGLRAPEDLSPNA